VGGPLKKSQLTLWVKYKISTEERFVIVKTTEKKKRKETKKQQCPTQNKKYVLIR
jgi:hypothetical protein